MTGTTIRIRALDDRIELRRDAYGIAHISTTTEADAWFGQGFASAEDRLWQMEYDRRRAVGRWAEAAGKAGTASDLVARKLNLEAAARADVGAMNARTRAMFESYAAGVNAFVASGRGLPSEYRLTGIGPEPWEPWHSVAVFKIRHILMGQWQLKAAYGRLLAAIGPERFQALDALPPARSAVILPPGGRISRAYRLANTEITEVAAHLGFLAEAEGGSNSWAVHGSRMTTGRPMICNDSHRALDVPNAYWQIHVRCPEFDVSGATFAGFPGFPHFGFNGHVAWNITHTQADYQDLYVERFRPAAGSAPRAAISDPPSAVRDPLEYLTEDGWVAADHRREVVRVRGGEAVAVDCWRTRHGPVVHGDPRLGYALSLRYTANDGPKPAFEAVRPMTTARTLHELNEAQRTWVDPVNNLVSADGEGNIAYLTRGELPVRSSAAGRLVPAPGWTGEHEWLATVPFEQMPRAVNPPEGYIATANQRVIDGDVPYISAAYAPPSRGERLVELLHGTGSKSPAEVAGWQGDTTSVPARAWSHFLAGKGPFDGEAELARVLLGGWDGNLLPDSSPATLYAYFRRALARELFAPLVGEASWAWLTAEANAGGARIVAGLLANVLAALDTGDDAPGGRPWADVLRPALTSAWAAAVRVHGPSPTTWRWARLHTTGSKHPLASSFPGEALDPPRAPVGGDADTLQAAGYGWNGNNDFVLASTSVYRQVVDFADPESASFIIPGGASGDPRSPHFADQLRLWARHERVPMRDQPSAVRHP